MTVFPVSAVAAAFDDAWRHDGDARGGGSGGEGVGSKRTQVGSVLEEDVFIRTLGGHLMILGMAIICAAAFCCRSTNLTLTLLMWPKTELDKHRSESARLCGV